MSKPHQVLILWEGVGWEDLQFLLDEGRLPHLARFCEEGMMGRLAGLEPSHSAASAVSLGCGQPPCVHGIYDAFAVKDGRVLERHSQEWHPIWEALASEGQQVATIGWPLTHPARPGSHRAVTVSDRFANSAASFNYRFTLPSDSLAAPEELAQRLRACRMVSSELGLSILREFYQVGDDGGLPERERLNWIREALGATYSHHAAALEVLEHGQSDFLAMSYPTFTRLVEVDEAPTPISNEWYRMYEVLDQLLGSLLSVLSEETTIHLVSSHSYSQPFSDAPKPQSSGVWLAKGPNIRADQLFHGATVLDVAPTVLALQGAEMEGALPGRVCRQLFQNEGPKIAKRLKAGVASSVSNQKKLPWESLLRDGRDRIPFSDATMFSSALVTKIAKRNQVAKFLSLRQHGRAADAEIALTGLHLQHPDDLEILLWIAELFTQEKDYPKLSEHLLNLRKHASAAQVLQAIELYECTVLLGEQKYEALEEKLTAITGGPELTPHQQLKVAGFQNQLGQLEQAYATCSALCEKAPDLHEAWFLKARLLVQMEAYSQAEEVVRYLLDLIPNDQKSRVLLADILLRQGRAEEAVSLPSF